MRFSNFFKRLFVASSKEGMAGRSNTAKGAIDCIAAAFPLFLFFRFTLQSLLALIQQISEIAGLRERRCFGGLWE